MQDKQIISQLKSLQKIKPAKDWAVLIKKDLLTEPVEFKNIPEKISFGEAVFSFFAKPSVVVSSLILVGVAVTGTFAYFGLQKKNYDLQAYIENLAFQNQENKEVLAGLQDVQARMDEVKNALVSLKSSNDPKKIFAVSEVIKSTAKNSQTAIDQIKSSGTDLSKQTLLSLSKVKETSQELQKNSAELQKETFKAYLAELKTKTLTDEDQERLVKAEEYFNDGNIESAIILLVRIGETGQ